MATARMASTCNTGGSSMAAPTMAAITAANRYCPSTPMLNRFIWNPMATANPAK